MIEPETKPALRLLLVDDDEDEYIITANLLSGAQKTRFSLTWACQAQAAFAALDQQEFDAVLVDYDMGSESGLDLIRAAIRAGYWVPFILITGRSGPETDLEAMRAGAADFVTKQELTAAVLERTIRYAVQHRRHEQILQRERDQLRELNQQLLRQAFILDQVHDIIIVTDPQMRITYWNKTAQEVYGYTPEEAIGKIAGDLLQSHLSDDQREVALQQMQEQKIFQVEISVIAKDGHVLFVEGTSKAITDEQGNLLGYVSANRDITARKQMEQALRESEADAKARAEELQTLMDTVPAMIWIAHDSQCLKMTGNRYGYEILRMTEPDNISKSAPENEIQRQPYRNFRNGQEIPREELPMQVAAATGRPINEYEFDLVFDDGTARTVVGNVSPLFDAHGQPSGAVAAFIDITERKQAERVMSESELRYRQLVEFSPDTIFVQVDGRFAMINPAGLKLLGADRPEQLLGTPVFDRIHPKDLQNLIDRIHTLNVERRPVPLIEETMLKLDGSPVEVDAIAAPYEFDGKPGALVIMRDITARKMVEATARESSHRIEVQRRLIEQREQERMQIARDLHDGPMQGLIAVVFQLDEIIQTTRKASLIEQLTEARDQLQAQISELRLFAGELRPPTLMSFGLEKAIRAHLQDFHVRYPGIEVRFTARQEGGLLPENPRIALYRIYQELLFNIVKHAGATTVQVHLEKTLEQVTLQVRDNGRGFVVPENWLDLARQKHLGLVGIRERAEAVGGKVDIHSAPGQGTSVTLSIPLDSSGPVDP